MKRPIAALVALATLISLGILSTAYASDDQEPKFVNEVVGPLQPCGEFLGGEEGTGFQRDTDTYDYQGPSPLTGTPPVLAAGNAVDLHWVHDFDSSPDPNVGTPLRWDFGAGGVDEVLLFPSIDHGPIPGEGVEATVYGSDSPTGPWVAGTLEKVFEPGWNPGWIADDFVSEWRLPDTFRYIAVKWGGPEALQADGDAEIDSVCHVDDDDDDDDDEPDDD